MKARIYNFIVKCDLNHVQNAIFVTIFNIRLSIPCELILKTGLQHLSTLKKVNRLKVFNIYFLQF